MKKKYECLCDVHVGERERERERERREAVALKKASTHFLNVWILQLSREREKRDGRVGLPAWRRGVPWNGAGGDSPATREDPTLKAFSFFTSHCFHNTHARTLPLTHTFTRTLSLKQTQTHTCCVYFRMKLH